MKNILLLFALLFLTTTATTAQDLLTEKEAIKKVIQTAYVDGLQNEGDSDKIDAGFHPDFAMLGVDKEQNLWKYSVTDWKASALKKKESGKLPLLGDEKISVKFRSIDITGTAAVAKIEYFVGTKLTYVDYISLYQFKDGWKMVSKIYTKI